MSPTMRTFVSSQRGFSLIELMVALLLSLFLVGGVVAVFMSNSATSHVQQSLSRVLENGRYASQYMADELRMTGAQYCAQYATALPTSTGMTPVKPVYMNVSAAASRPKWVPAAVAPFVGTRYPLDPGIFVRGYKCTTAGTCTPTLPTAANDINVVPAAGTTAGTRAKGTDVLTIRYLNGTGRTIAGSAGGAGQIDLGAAPGAAPLSLAAGDLAMIADCGNAEVFAPGLLATAVTHTVADGNYVPTLVGSFTRPTDSRVFNFSRDFVSVTYYIALQTDPEDGSRMIPVLMRIVNGAAAQPVVLGVERFDLTFAVADGKQDLHYLNAAEVENAPAGILCPPVQYTPAPTAGCLWRALQGIEVSMLINSIRDDGPGSDPFRYSPDGTALQALAPTATLPNGLPAGRMLRREFRFLASVHNFSR